MPDLATPTFAFLKPLKKGNIAIPADFCRQRLSLHRDCPGFNLASHASACGFAAAAIRLALIHLEGVRLNCERMVSYLGRADRAQDVWEDKLTLLREARRFARRAAGRIRQTQSTLAARRLCRDPDGDLWPVFGPTRARIQRGSSPVGDVLAPLMKILTAIARRSARKLGDTWSGMRRSYNTAYEILCEFQEDLEFLLGRIEDHFGEVEGSLAPRNFGGVKNGAVLLPRLADIVTEVAKESGFWDNRLFAEKAPKSRRKRKRGRKT